MERIINDLYNPTTRTRALQWALAHLVGHQLIQFYKVLSSISLTIPAEQTLQFQIGQKYNLCCQQMQGIGADPGTAPTLTGEGGRGPIVTGEDKEGAIHDFEIDKITGQRRTTPPTPPPAPDTGSGIWPIVAVVSLIALVLAGSLASPGSKLKRRIA